MSTPTAGPVDAEADLTPAERLLVDAATALMIGGATVIAWAITLTDIARQKLRRTQ